VHGDDEPLAAKELERGPVVRRLGRRLWPPDEPFGDAGGALHDVLLVLRVVK
jgi:hypothetical protein